FAECIFLAGFHSERVIVAIRLAKCAIVKKVVAHLNIGHRRLRRNCFHGGMRVNSGFGGEKSGIGSADDADASIIIANIFKDKDVAADGEFGKLRANVIRIVVADSVGSAIQDKWKRSIRVSGSKNNGEKFY